MAKLGINTGSAPDAGDGDSLQQGAIKINSNFDEVYTLLGNGTALAPGIVTSIVGGNNIAVSTSVGQVTLNVTGNTWDDNTTGINTLSNVGIGTTNATDELKVSGTVKTDQIVVVGVSTFQNDVNFNYDLTIGEDASLERNLKVTGVSTFVGESNFNDSVLITGITTCNSLIDANGDLDVDGHTELDNLNVSGVSTFASNVYTGQITATSLSLSSGGISAAGGSANLNWGTGNFYFNGGGDPEIGWVSGNGIIRSLGAGSTIFIKGGNPGENMGVFRANGASELYYNNAKKIETTNTGVTVTGALNANSFVGDGSGLTGVNATGTGVSISDGGSFIGVASAINFGSNLSVSPISVGIVTITGQAGGASTADVRTNTLNVSGMATFAMGYYGSGSEVRFYSEHSPGASLSISHPAGNPYGVYMRFMSHDGDDATIVTDSNANMTIDAGANIHLRVNGDSVLSGTQNSGTTLSYSGAQKLATTSGGVTVTGTTFSNQLNVSGVSTFAGITTVTGQTLFSKQLSISGISSIGGNIIVGHNPSTQGTGSILKAHELNLTGPNSTDSNSTFYSNIRANKVGGGFKYDIEFHSNGYSSGDIGDFIFYRRGTSSQRYERMRLSGETGNLTVTGGGSFAGIVTATTFSGAGVTVTGTTFSNQLNVSGVSTFTGYTTFGSHVSLGNNSEIRLGSSDLMKMYYSSSGDVGAFVQSLNSDLHLVGSTNGGVRIITYNKDSLVANYNGSVDLYHNGSKKFETTGAGVTITGVCTATSFVGDISTATAGKWTLGANGTSDYTFTGIGFTQTTNDPVLYLARGRVYEFVNGMGAHPFEIRVSAGGAAYNAGVTNNGASNGTIKFEIPMDAPNTLYYQCTSHAGMGNTISVYPNTI